MNWPHGHSAAERIMSMKNSSDTNGNRSRDIPVCSAVPQPLHCRLYIHRIGVIFLNKPRKIQTFDKPIIHCDSKIRTCQHYMWKNSDHMSYFIPMASKTKTNSKTVFVCLRACTCVLKHPLHFRDLRLSDGGLKNFVFWRLKGWDLVDKYRCIRGTCSLHCHDTFQAVRSFVNPAGCTSTRTHSLTPWPTKNDISSFTTTAVSK
jgi:hypothetical protein